jgi:hypothetical protein
MNSALKAVMDSREEIDKLKTKYKGKKAKKRKAA